MKINSLSIKCRRHSKKNFTQQRLLQISMLLKSFKIYAKELRKHMTLYNVHDSNLVFYVFLNFFFFLWNVANIYDELIYFNLSYKNVFILYLIVCFLRVFAILMSTSLHSFNNSDQKRNMKINEHRRRRQIASTGAVMSQCDWLRTRSVVYVELNLEFRVCTRRSYITPWRHTAEWNELILSEELVYSQIFLNVKKFLTKRWRNKIKWYRLRFEHFT